jgi:hypothetical protein
MQTNPKVMKQVNARIYLIALFISIVSINSGCKKDGIFCEKGKGSTITETRGVSGFTTVKNEMDATLYVSQGPAFSVTVEAQGNLMENIKTEVKGSELRVYAKHCIRKHDPIVVRVTMPMVNGIAVDGSGSAYAATRIETSSIGISIAGSGSFGTTDSIVATYCQTSIAGSGNAVVLGRFDAIDTRIAGSGNVRLSGSGNASDIDISGSGDVHAYELPVKTCSVTISGSGNAEVNATDHLDVAISGSGDVFYKGTPTVSVSTSGSGSIQNVP